MDNFHKYYYLIAFAGYMLEAAELAQDAVSDEINAEVTENMLFQQINSSL